MPGHDRRGRGPVAQVQDDLLEVVAPQELGDRPGDELVAGAVSPVAADGVGVGDLAVQGVAGGLLGQVLEEGGVEDGHVRHVGQEAAPHLDALEVGGVVQRAQRHELLDPGHDVVVDEGRAGEVAPALDDPVAHGHDVGVGQRGALLLEQAQHLGQAEAVVGDRLGDLGALLAVLVGDGAGLLTDALHQARGERGARVGVDQLVLDGGGAGVDNEDGALSHGVPFKNGRG